MYIKPNDPQSAYAAHILKSLHEYGTFDNTMFLFKCVKNGSSVNSFEQFYT
jgi:hypothetical protein